MIHWMFLFQHFRICVGDIVVINVSATILAHHEFNTKEFENITKEWLRQSGQRLTEINRRLQKRKNRRRN